MTKIEQYLTEFKTASQDWFSRQDWLEPRFQFFRNFLKQDNLANAGWKDFQEMGNNLHCFNSMPLAKKKALGSPNHSISYYQEVFEYIVRGNDPINVRLQNLGDSSSNFYLKNFGNAALSEIIGYAFADQYAFYNKRHREALRFLGINVPVDRGDS